jgi:hypothetical protein
MRSGAWKFSEAAHNVIDETAQRLRRWTCRSLEELCTKPFLKEADMLADHLG